MRALLTMLLVLGAAPGGLAKVFGKCELARLLEGRHGLPREDVRNWVCIAEYESTFNTEAVNKYNWDGSWDYGLFQLNNKYWCGNTGKNVCRIPCSALLDDDLTDDLACIRRIVKDTERWKGAGTGLTAWVAYVNRCQNRDLEEYMAECKRETQPPSIDTADPIDNFIPREVEHPESTGIEDPITKTITTPATALPQSSTTASQQSSATPSRPSSATASRPSAATAPRASSASALRQSLVTPSRTPSSSGTLTQKIVTASGFGAPPKEQKRPVRNSLSLPSTVRHPPSHYQMWVPQTSGSTAVHVSSNAIPFMAGATIPLVLGIPTLRQRTGANYFVEAGYPRFLN